MIYVELNDLTFKQRPECAHPHNDVCFCDGSDAIGLPVCRLKDSFAKNEQQQQQQVAFQGLLDQLDVVHRAVDQVVLASSPASADISDVIEPTQLTPDSAASPPAAVTAGAGLAANYIYESCIPATCEDLMPPDWPSQQHEGLQQQQQQQQQHSQQDRLCCQPSNPDAQAQLLLSAHHKGGACVDSTEQRGSPRDDNSKLQPGLLQQNSTLKQPKGGVQPVSDAQQLQANRRTQQQESTPGLQAAQLRSEGVVQCALEDPTSKLMSPMASHVAAAPPVAAGAAAAAVAAPGPSNKGRLSLLPVNRDAHAQHHQQQHFQPQQHWQQQCNNNYSGQCQLQMQMQQPAPQLGLQQQAPLLMPDAGTRFAAGQAANLAPTWWPQQPQSRWPAHVLQQPPQLQPLTEQPQTSAGGLQGNRCMPPAPGAAQHKLGLPQQATGTGSFMVPIPAASHSAGSGGRMRGPSAAARAYRQQKPFKAPQRALAAVAAAAASAAPPAGGAVTAACNRPSTDPPGLLSRPAGSFKPPNRQQPVEPAGQAATMLDGAQVSAAAGFITGRGGNIPVSAVAQARAAALLQEEFGDVLPGHGGTTAAVAGCIGAHTIQAAAVISTDSALEGKDAAALPGAVCAAGFTTGRGNSITVSAAAKARAQQLLQEELQPELAELAASAGAQGPAAPVASSFGTAAPSNTVQQEHLQHGDTAAATPGFGFVTGRGGSISVSVAAKALAQQLLQEELGNTATEDAAAGQQGPVLLPCGAEVLTHQQQHEAAAGGFVTGRGGSIPISGAARAKAAALLHEELGTPPAGQQQQLPANSLAFAEGAQPSNTAATVPLAAAEQDGPAQKETLPAPLRQQQQQHLQLHHQQQGPTAQQPEGPGCEEGQQGAQQQQRAEAGATLAQHAPEIGAAHDGFYAADVLQSDAAPAQVTAADESFDLSLASEDFAYLDRLVAEAEQLAARAKSAQAAAHAGDSADQVVEHGTVQQQPAQLQRPPEGPHHSTAAKGHSSTDTQSAKQQPGSQQMGVQGCQEQQQQQQQQAHLPQVQAAPMAARQPQEGQLLNSPVPVVTLGTKSAATAAAAAVSAAVAASGPTAAEEDIIIADSQPDSQADFLPQPAATNKQPAAPVESVGQLAHAAAPAQDALNARGPAAAAAVAAALPGRVSAAAGAGAGAATVSDGQAGQQQIPPVGNRQQKAGRTATPGAAAGAVAGAVPQAALVGRSFPPPQTALQAVKHTNKHMPRAYLKVGNRPAAAAAVAVPVAGVQWASGDGVMLSPSALQRGEAFLQQLVSARLLPPTGSAWRAQQQPLLVELLVTPDGRLLLLLAVTPTAPQPSPAAATSSAAGLGSKASAGDHAAWQQPQQQLEQQQQARQQGPSNIHSRANSAGHSRPRPAGKPPTYTPSGAAGSRKSRVGAVTTPKRGSLQHLWGVAAGLDSLSGSKRTSSVAGMPAPPAQRLPRAQSLHTPPPAAAGGPRTAGGMPATESPAARLHNKQELLLPAQGKQQHHQQGNASMRGPAVADGQVPRRQQQGSVTSTALNTPASSCGLMTAGGQQVAVSEAARQQFQQLLAVGAKQQSAGVQQPIHAGPATVPTAEAVMQRSQLQPPQDWQRHHAGGDARPQHTAEASDGATAAMASAAATSSGIRIAGKQQALVGSAEHQEFQQRLRCQHGVQQQQQQQQEQEQEHMQEVMASRCARQATCEGERADVAVSAATNGHLGHLHAHKQEQQQQQQQQQGCLLSTASGRKVEASAQAQERFKQLLGKSHLPPQQHGGAADGTGSGRIDRDSPRQVPAGSEGTPAALATLNGQACDTSRMAALPAAATPAVAHTSASGAVTPAALPSPIPVSAFKTPGLAPRIASRKRSLSHPCTPGLLQQHQQGSGTEDGTASSSNKVARKAFRPPAMNKPIPMQPQSGLQAAHTSDTSHTMQRMQVEPVDRGLSLAQYFALAQAQRAQQCEAPSTSTGAAATSTANNGSALVWAVESVPTSPHAAAAFTFRAVVAPGEDSSGIKPGPQGAQHAAPAPAAVGATFGAAEAQQVLLAWGADAQKATAAWVANHFKWIVWKLAAYDRKLLGLTGSSRECWSSRSAGAACVNCCLTAHTVMQQLQLRYTREAKEGQRSVLRKILEQDLPAGVPMVLLVSDIRSRGSSMGNKPGAAAAAAGDAEVLGVQLSDGWYYANAMVDGPIADLINSRRLQVGAKVRVVGAELRSDRAAEPLEAARTALLKVSFNGMSPAAWDAKLGPVPGETIRPLTCVHPSGGLVPRLLLLVQRRYQLLYWCRSSKHYVTGKGLARAQQMAERQQEQALGAATSTAMQEELQQCKQWASSRSASPVQRAYAAAVLQADGGCAGGAEGFAACGHVSTDDLQAFRESRKSHVEGRKQHHLQQELQRAEAAAAAQAGGGQLPWLTAAASVGLSEPPIPVLHLRVAGVVPQGLGPSWGHGAAVVKVWRPCEAVQQLEEGSVVLATGLSAGTDGRSSTVDGRGKVLELSSGKMTSWRLLGHASSCSATMDVPPWCPRTRVRVQQLSPGHIKGEVDFNGVLVWAGDVRTDGREWSQWIFATDDSAVAAAADGAQPVAAQSGGQPVPCPPLVAIYMSGAPTAIDWLPPSAGTQAPGVQAGSTAQHHTALRSNGSRLMRAEPRQQLSCVVATNLLVDKYDAAHCLWVMNAHSTAGVHMVSSSDARVKELCSWARQNMTVLDACRAKVQQLLGG